MMAMTTSSSMRVNARRFMNNQTTQVCSGSASIKGARGDGAIRCLLFRASTTKMCADRKSGQSFYSVGELLRKRIKFFTLSLQPFYGLLFDLRMNVPHGSQRL